MSNKIHIFVIEIEYTTNMDTFIKILGTIAAIIIAIALLPFFIAAIMWLIKIVAGFTIGGFLVVLLIVLILYIIFG